MRQDPQHTGARRRPRPAKTILLLPFFCLGLVGGQPLEKVPPGISQAMQGSIERQRSSVRQQRAAPTPEEMRERVRQAMTASVEKQRASALAQRQSAQPRTVSLWGSSPLSSGASAWTARSSTCRGTALPRIHDHIERVARREGLTPELVRTVIDHESRFQPCAVSSKGALGLMQLMPQTARELGVADPFDPIQNIDGGTRYLSRLMSRYQGNLSLALAAYNAGPTRVDFHQDVPPIAETRRYVRGIIGDLGIETGP